METISFTKSTLEEFIHSDKFDQLINIPISKLRANSQINNPRANNDHVLLVAQFDENKTVGYLGILPDEIHVDNQTHVIGWLTCFWVDEAYKSQNVAANLFLRAIRAYNKNIFITNIVPRLETVYQKTKLFLPTVYKTGFRGYFRFNLAEILPPKKDLFQKIKPLLQLGDTILNAITDIRFVWNKQKSLGNFEYINSIDLIPEDFFLKHQQKNWIKRSKKEINWILQYPWLIQGTDYEQLSKRYYFSCIEKAFETKIVQFKNENGEIIALLILNIKNKHLTVPYLFGEEIYYPIISSFIYNLMSSERLKMFTIYHNEFSNYLSNCKTPFLFSKEMKKPYFISKKFEALKTLYFQDGDGDCAFY
jgi:hypothetical protein